MDKWVSDFIGGLLVVFIALLINYIMPAMWTIYGTITLGILVSGGIAALIVPYIRKALNF